MRFGGRYGLDKPWTTNTNNFPDDVSRHCPPSAKLSPTFSDNDVYDTAEKRRAKRRRIEDCARRYLGGQDLHLFSAQLRGPIQGNPWGKQDPPKIKNKSASKSVDKSKQQSLKANLKSTKAASIGDSQSQKSVHDKKVQQVSQETNLPSEHAVEVKDKLTYNSPPNPTPVFPTSSPTEVVNTSHVTQSSVINDETTMYNNSLRTVESDLFYSKRMHLQNGHTTLDPRSPSAILKGLLPEIKPARNKFRTPSTPTPNLIERKRKVSRSGGDLAMASMKRREIVRKPEHSPSLKQTKTDELNQDSVDGKPEQVKSADASTITGPENEVARVGRTVASLPTFEYRPGKTKRVNNVQLEKVSNLNLVEPPAAAVEEDKTIDAGEPTHQRNDVEPTTSNSLIAPETSSDQWETIISPLDRPSRIDDSKMSKSASQWETILSRTNEAADFDQSRLSEYTSQWETILSSAEKIVGMHKSSPSRHATDNHKERKSMTAYKDNLDAGQHLLAQSSTRDLGSFTNVTQHTPKSELDRAKPRQTLSFDERLLKSSPKVASKEPDIRKSTSQSNHNLERFAVVKGSVLENKQKSFDFASIPTPAPIARFKNTIKQYSPVSPMCFPTPNAISPIESQHVQSGAGLDKVGTTSTEIGTSREVEEVLESHRTVSKVVADQAPASVTNSQDGSQRLSQSKSKPGASLSISFNSAPASSPPVGRYDPSITMAQQRSQKTSNKDRFSQETTRQSFSKLSRREVALPPIAKSHKSQKRSQERVVTGHPPAEPSSSLTTPPSTAEMARTETSLNISNGQFKGFTQGLEVPRQTPMANQSTPSMDREKVLSEFQRGSEEKTSPIGDSDILEPTTILDTSLSFQHMLAASTANPNHKPMNFTPFAPNATPLSELVSPTPYLPRNLTSSQLRTSQPDSPPTINPAHGNAYDMMSSTRDIMEGMTGFNDYTGFNNPSTAIKPPQPSDIQGFTPINVHDATSTPYQEAYTVSPLRRTTQKHTYMTSPFKTAGLTPFNVLASPSPRKRRQPSLVGLNAPSSSQYDVSPLKFDPSPDKAFRDHDKQRHHDEEEDPHNHQDFSLDDVLGGVEDYLLQETFDVVDEAKNFSSSDLGKSVESQVSMMAIEGGDARVYERGQVGGGGGSKGFVLKTARRG